MMCKVSRRRVVGRESFFHFRHWDDFASSGSRVVWPLGEEAAKGMAFCMVSSALFFIIFTLTQNITVKYICSMLFVISSEYVQVLYLSRAEGTVGRGHMIFESCASILSTSENVADVNEKSIHDNKVTINDKMTSSELAKQSTSSRRRRSRRRRRGPSSEIVT